MYLGIALLPWVLLYGVTALLFNHSTWMSPSYRWDATAEQVSAVVAGLPEPDEIGRTAFAGLADVASEESASQLEFVAGSARWLGSISLTGRSEVDDLRGSLDPAGRGGYFRASPRDPEDAEGEETAEAEADWRELEKLESWEPGTSPEEVREGIEEGVRELLAAEGKEVSSMSARRLPRVRFEVSSESGDYACDVGLDGEISVRPVDELSTLRSKLLRLHVQHGDPGYAGIRQLWAWIVDIMGIAMVLWGVTGIVMWWNIRPTRAAGSIALVSGIGAMAALAWLVWRAMGMS